jgi:hypothetical protein
MAEKIILGKNGQWGVKENGLLAYNDEDNIFKAIEMNHSRSSTATRVNSSGTIAESGIGVPRIDFSDSSDGALLLEPQSTNLFTYSEDLSSYSTIRGTLTLDSSEVAPDGSLGVYYLTATSADGLLLDAQSTAGDSTFSVYVKRKTGTGVVELSVDGAVTKTPISVTSEWQRFSLSTASGLGQIVVNCETSGDEVYVWGLQAEELSYPTSYIPTSGTTATRITETCSKSGLDNYINSSEGVLYFEGRAIADDLTVRRLSLSDSSWSNSITIYFDSVSNQITALIRDGGSGVGICSTTSYTTTENLKIAYKYKSGDIALWINGVEADTSTDTISLPLITDLRFDRGDGSAPFYGKVKDLRVYSEALTDSELQTLTSL